MIVGRVNVVQCPYCGEEIEGLTHAAVVEDAIRLGWEGRGLTSQLVCPGCLDEEDNL